MSSPVVGGWRHEEPLTDEVMFTPEAQEGWLAWNGQSPEVAFCDFGAMLALMAQPCLVVETGVGQGYMTRSLVRMLHENQQLVAYESNDQWRQTMWSLPFWQEHRFNARLSGDPTPSDVIVAEADLCVFDSDFEHRFTEVEMWDCVAKPGAVALIHDTADRPDTIHQSLRELILGLGMTGVFLKNPRGCFMAVQGNKEE